MILFIEDETNTANDFTIKVDFFNAKCKVLYTETRTFGGFAPKWGNYFIFRTPLKEFDSYICTVEKIPYTGIVYSGYLQSRTEEMSAKIGPIIDLRDGIRYDSLGADFVTVNFSTEALS